MADSRELFLDLERAKVKLNSIGNINEAVINIHKSFPEFGAPELREAVRQIKNLHPITNEVLETLEFFQPISEEIGSRTLQHTPDTPTLDIEDWGTNWTEDLKKEAPRSVRNILHQKLKSSRAAMINDSYAKLNELMVGNLSREFSEGSPRRVPFGIAVGHHLRPDGMYLTIINDSKDGIIKELREFLGDVINLINHQVPIVAAVSVNPGLTFETVEGKGILVDLRGNKSTPGAFKINNDVLTAS